MTLTEALDRLRAALPKDSHNDSVHDHAIRTLVDHHDTEAEPPDA